MWQNGFLEIVLKALNNYDICSIITFKFWILVISYQGCKFLLSYTCILSPISTEKKYQNLKKSLQK